MNRAKLLAITAVVALCNFVLGGFFVWWILSEETPETPAPVRKFQLTVTGQTPQNNSAALSPDGKAVAYIADDRLWVRTLADLVPRMIPETEGAIMPFWSPDGDSLGYFDPRSGNLKGMALEGETPFVISPLTNYGAIGGAVWRPDGVIIFSQGPAGLLASSPARGDNPTPFLEPSSQSGEAGIYAPHLLPDGKTLLFSVWKKDGQWSIEGLTPGGIRKHILDAPPGEIVTGAVYAASGHLLYNRTERGHQNIWGVAFSPDDLSPVGKPFLLVSRAAWPGVSRDHILVYTTSGGNQQQQLTWFGRNGQPLGTADPPLEALAAPAISPEDDAVTVAGQEQGRWDIWKYDVARGGRTRLTFDAVSDRFPVWSGEGDHVAFVREQSDSSSIVVMATDGTRIRETVAVVPKDELAPVWSRDGYYLVYQRRDEETGAYDLWYIPMNKAERAPVRFTRTPFDEMLPRFSPDGRYLAYQSNESGDWEVYVVRFPDGGKVWQVSQRGGFQPRWSYWTEELFYIRNESLMAVRVRTEPDFSIPGGQIQLFIEQGIMADPAVPIYDVTNDGQRFIMIRDGGYTSASTITVVENWFEEFREPAPPAQ